MAESHVISALVSKRSEYAGLIEYHRKELSRLADEVKTLDATIKIFNPEYRIKSIKPRQYRKTNKFFKSGEAHRLLLDILRDANEPLSTLAVVDEAIKRKGFALDAEQLAKLKASIGNTLKTQSKSGLIQEVGKEKGVSLWCVI